MFWPAAGGMFDVEGSVYLAMSFMPSTFYIIFMVSVLSKTKVF
jgi:hypothetical protein